MNTFIANTADGSKVDFLEGKVRLGNLNPLYEAKHCTCDESTENVSEITDWDTAEDVSYTIEG
jgi:hypothetical protein